MNEQTGLQVVPLPKRFKVAEGKISLRKYEIEVKDAELAPLVAVVEEDLEAVLSNCDRSRLEEKTAIELRVDRNMLKEQVRLRAARSLSITGGSYEAVSSGAAMLIQLITDEGNIPVCDIEDEPDLPYRGLMIDLGRNWHSTAFLYTLIKFCRFYRFSHLHLHLTDDPLFTFPLKAFPGIPDNGLKYDRTELELLVEYARHNGVQLVPEIDLPGHSLQLNRSDPELFAGGRGEAHGEAICLGHPAIFDAIAIVLAELCDVFKYSRYIHIGGDEARLELFEQCPACRRRMQELQASNGEDLVRDYIVKAAEIVKKLGRQPIVWEGFSAKPGIAIPKDIIVIPWESHYHHADVLAEQGYTLINASWQPLYGTRTLKWSPEHIYGWHARRWEHWWEKSRAALDSIEVDESRAALDSIEVDERACLLGAQYCTWDIEEQDELDVIRLRAPTMVERVWNVIRREKWSSFAPRLQQSDDRLVRWLAGLQRGSGK